MIIAEQKTIAEISSLIKNVRKILLLGCGSCVTVCLTGGEKETEILASALRIKRGIENNPVDIQTCTVTRQCDPEFIDNIQDLVREVDAVVSLACGVGPQYLAERYQNKYIVPAMNTTFVGGSKTAGVWEERCSLCGDCNLHLTAGICPVTLCPKSILNGPCGPLKTSTAAEDWGGEDFGGPGIIKKKKEEKEKKIKKNILLFL